MDKPKRKLVEHMRMAEIIKELGISRATFWRLREREDFPKGIKITSRTIIWRVRDVEEWLLSKEK